MNHSAFIHANTTLLPVPLVPQIQLYLAHESVPLWQKTEEELGKIGLPPPFWAFAWAGGQALARYVLDHPVAVKGKHVLDLASGSGLVAIAAMQAGATIVDAADIDAFAIAAIRLNSEINKIMLYKSVQDVFLAQSLESARMDRMSVKNYIFLESKKWEKVVKQTGAKVD